MWPPSPRKRRGATAGDALRDPALWSGLGEPGAPPEPSSTTGSLAPPQPVPPVQPDPFAARESQTYVPKPVRPLSPDRTQRQYDVAALRGPRTPEVPDTEPNPGYPGDPGQSPSDPPTTPVPPTGGKPGIDQFPPFDPALHHGFDPAKWNNPAHQSVKYKVGRFLASGGSLAKAAALAGPGWQAVGDDVLVAPDGSTFDVFLGFSETGTRRIQWTQTSGPGGQPFAADPVSGTPYNGSTGTAGTLLPASGRGQTPATTTPGSTTPSTTTPFRAEGPSRNIGPDPLRNWEPGRDPTTGEEIGTGPGGHTNALRDQILAALSKLITDNSAELGDISGTPGAKAYGVANQRESDYLRSAMAERLAAQGMGNVEGGGSSGAFDSEFLGIAQEQGERQAQYEAQLAERMLSERQGRLLQGLQLGAGYLTDQQRLELQAQLQRVNEALEIARLQLNNQQFYDDLGYRIGATEASLINQ